MTTTEHDYAAQARNAIAIVCSGDLSRIEELYRPDFTDHVNDMTFHGYDGGSAGTRLQHRSAVPADPWGLTKPARSSITWV